MTNNNRKVKTFICNPDVVLREEDDSGGLLFNPDTGQVKVVNTSGLVIWKIFTVEHGYDEVVDIILDEFEDASPEQVKSDVEEYLGDLLTTGFIGEVQ